MTGIRLSIIIVNYNTDTLLKDCLNSIFQYPPKKQFEIIVIDNGSTDDSVIMLEKDFSNIQLIKNNSNLGFAKANNIGIKLSQGDYVLLLNSDTLILPESLNKIINYMDSHLSVGILGPRLTGLNGETLQMSWCGAPISLSGEIVIKLFSPKYISKYRFARFIVDYIQRRERKVMHIAGASMIIRKKVFKDIGLLDENFFLFFEEPDFCWRARKKCWDVVFNPDIKVIHKLGSSTKKLGSSVMIHYRKSQLYFYKKHHSKYQQNCLRLYLLIKFHALKILHQKNAEIYNQLIKLVKES
ncbi:MAG: putative glycosyltransferase [Parcubacteria group bacterium Athens1014_10]|nr:MAG: putative glycosyltransferase [Parcubacteria group bacterium Athens1014_10]TSD05230.1 MAG: putative glycosyltransferase [Parcubacteria group bacterium Athens0714_12]